MPSSQNIALVLILWLLLSFAISATGILDHIAPVAPQFILVTLTLVSFAVAFCHPPTKQWLRQVDERVLVSLHFTRLVGFYFLYLYDRGELPFEFAVYGGIGDIIVALWAMILVFAGRADSRQQRRSYFVWNVFGLVDILLVVATAAKSALTDPASMIALRKLPLSLLPLWLVPLIIVSHIVLAMRLSGRWSNAG